MPFEIKNPITGVILQVAEEDFPDSMDWYDAMAACQNLGNGWRLPTKEELKAMYEQLHKHGKGNFGDSIDGGGRWYWSSSQGNSNNAWSMYFDDGSDDDYLNKDNDYGVRAVRDLP